LPVTRALHFQDFNPIEQSCNLAERSQKTQCFQGSASQIRRHGLPVLCAVSEYEHELNRLLRTLGITTVYVTHDQSEAMVLGDRIIVMGKGAIAQIGTPRDIYFAPASRFVAEFIGAANIIDAGYSNGSLLLPGGKLAASPDNSTTKERVLVMIRPESIRIVAAEGAGLCGQIETVSFVGDRQRAAIGEVAAKPIMVDVSNSVALKPGDRVGLAIDPSAVRLLPPEPV